MGQQAVDAVIAAFVDRPGVTLGRAFATESLMVNEKIFALFRPEGVVFKLPKARVDGLIADGAGVPFTSGKRTMKEWVVVLEAQSDQWPDLAEEAYRFVGSGA